MFLALVDGTLCSLRHEVLVAHASSERRVSTLVIVFLFGIWWRRLTRGQLCKEFRIATGVVVNREQHKVIVIVRRGKHNMLDMTTFGES